MSANQIWSQYGDAVRDAVQDALKTGDFKNFNEVVTSAAMEAMKTAGLQVGKGFTAQASKTQASEENYTQRWVRENNERKAAQQPSKNLPARVLLAPMERKGSVSGTLCQVFGGIGTGIMAVMATIFLGLGLGIGGGYWTAFGVFFAFLAFFVGMIKSGNKKKSKLKRALKYLQLAGNNHYVDVEDLALHTNQDTRFVRKDVKRMLADGIFPEGHLDRQESCLMLDNKIYGEYLALEKQRKAQEQEMRALPEKPVAEKPGQETF